MSVVAKVIGVFSEGSLLRRTLVHVGAFLVGSVAFIAVTSFVLVSVAKGVVPGARSASAGASSASGASSAEAGSPASGASSGDDDDDADGDGKASPTAAKSRLGRHMKKRLGAAPAAE